MSREIVSGINDISTLIKADTVKIYCSLAANIRNEVIIPKIKLAEDLKLVLILGNSLYDRLVDEFNAANGVPSAIADGTTNADGINYQELYNKCVPVLSWWSAYYSLDAIAVKVDEKGVNVHTSDYTAEVDRASYIDKAKQYRTNAESYTEILQCYLQENLSDDEDYEDEGNTEEGKSTFGIFFSNKHKRKGGCKRCK